MRIETIGQIESHKQNTVPTLCNQEKSENN